MLKSERILMSYSRMSAMMKRSLTIGTFMMFLGVMLLGFVISPAQVSVQPALGDTAATSQSQWMHRPFLLYDRRLKTLTRQDTGQKRGCVLLVLQKNWHLSQVTVIRFVQPGNPAR